MIRACRTRVRIGLRLLRERGRMCRVIRLVTIPIVVRRIVVFCRVMSRCRWWWMVTLMRTLCCRRMRRLGCRPLFTSRRRRCVCGVSCRNRIRLSVRLSRFLMGVLSWRFLVIVPMFIGRLRSLRRRLMLWWLRSRFVRVVCRRPALTKSLVLKSRMCRVMRLRYWGLVRLRGRRRRLVSRIGRRCRCRILTPMSRLMLVFRG